MSARGPVWASQSCASAVDVVVVGDVVIVVIVVAVVVAVVVAAAVPVAEWLRLRSRASHR